jgi:hypothetical protein
MFTALTPVSNSVLHRFTSLALHSGVLQLPPSIASTVSVSEVLCTTLTCRNITDSLAVRWPYMQFIPSFEPSSLFQLVLVESSISFLENVLAFWLLWNEKLRGSPVLATVALRYDMWLKFAMLHSALFSLYLLVKASFTSAQLFYTVVLIEYLICRQFLY